MNLGIAFMLVLATALVGSWFFTSHAWARFLLAAGRRSAGLRSNSVEVDSVHWHFIEGGKGPLLLALHGFGGDSDNWLRAAPGLRRHFRLIAPDLPGFGESETSDPLDFDIPSQVERLHAFIERLGVQPMFLAGNSMGGWIAGAYALKYPKQIQAIWLLAPLGVANAPSSPLLAAISKDEASPLTISSPDQFRRRVMRPMFGRVPWIPYPLQDFYARRGIESSINASERFKQVTGSPRPMEQIIAGLDLPVHLQWGSLDRAVSPAGIKALRMSKPDIDVQLLEGVGHLPMLEAPGASVESWLRFCRDCHLLEGR